MTSARLITHYIGDDCDGMHMDMLGPEYRHEWGAANRIGMRSCVRCDTHQLAWREAAIRQGEFLPCR